MSFLITTTGTLSPVVLHDMGARTFVHPTTNFDLEPEYSIDELSLSVDLQNALDLGHVTIEYNGRSVASSIELKEVSVPLSAYDITYDNTTSLLSAINIQSAVDEIIARTTPTTTGGTGLTSYTAGDLLYASATNVLSKLPIGTNGYILTVAGGFPTWATNTGGTVTTVSVVSANGFAGTVATSTTTPAITLTTTITGILKGNGTAISAAVAGTDYQAPLSGTGIVKSTAGVISYVTDNSTNWDQAFSDRLKWDGGSTGLVAATGRTSLGATTVGSNLFTATNPSAITFLRVNADNTISLLDAATFRTAIGAGSGTVTSVSGTTDRITSTGGATPVIDISATYVGQTSITTLGTITTGVWNGTNIAIANGGTGATTANTALNNLLPSQTGNNAKVLSTDGTNSSWISVSIAGVNGGTVTSVDGSGGTTGLTLTGGPITVNGTLTLGGTLAIANGGTGATTALAAFNALSPLTTKGDLLTRNATDNIRISVGTNGQVLVADSTQASGMKWASADAIAGQPMRFLSANTANSNAVANTTVETNFTSNGTNYAMPANTPNTNSLMRFLVYGKFSTKSGAVGTLTIRLKIGSTILVANVVSPGSAITNSGFQFTGQMQFRTIGASGTVYSHLLCVFDAAGSSGSTTYCKSSNGTATIDTTVVNTIQMSAQWSTASTSNTITIEQATFEILN